MSSRPRIFIGSSSEARAVVDALVRALENDALVMPWTSSFNLSSYTLDALDEELEKADFAIFVFSHDDRVEIRGEQFSQTRDNVLFELGMSVGKLGRGCSFFLKPDASDLHIPSDLLGVTSGRYRHDDFRRDSNAAISPFAAQVRQALQREFRPIFPENSYYGPNLLTGNYCLINARQEYSLSAIAPRSRGIIVEITGDPLGQTSESVWFYSVGNVTSWKISTMERSSNIKQKFFLGPGEKGDVKVHFQGSGNCNIKVFLDGSDSPTNAIEVSWR